MRKRPKYTMHAPAENLVRFFCHGCGKGRYGSLNKPHPGDRALREAKDGEYFARCLVCGLTEDWDFYASR